MVQLLHGFTEKDLADSTLRSTLAEYLNHSRLPIRQLAHSLLSALVPESAGRTSSFTPIRVHCWATSSRVCFDSGCGQCHALAGNRHDQQKLVHLPLPDPADLSAISNPARS